MRLHLVREEEQVAAGLAHQLLAGVVVDGHRRGGRGRRSRRRSARSSRGGRRACGRRRIALGPGPQHELVAALERDPVDASRAARRGSSAAPRGAPARRRRVLGTRLQPAVQADDLLRRQRQRPLEHLADDRVLAGGLLALGVGQRVDVEDQRLLDLGVVEQVAAALGRRSAGGRAARSPRPSTASSSAVASTGQMLTLSRPASSGEMKRPSDDLDDDMGRDQRRSAAPAARSSPAATSAVLWTHARTSDAAVVERLGAQREARRRRTRSRRPARRRRPARARPGARRPRWRSPLGRQVAQRRASASRRAGSRHALEPRVVERARRTRPRRPAGRRSRTASGSRSWSPRACTGTARSPRTAARRRAPRALIASPAARAARRRRRRSSAARARRGAR